MTNKRQPKLLLLGSFIGAIFLYWLAFATSVKTRTPANTYENPSVKITKKIQCPQGYKLKYGTVRVSAEKCIAKDYRHYQNTHGVLRQRMCFHGGTSHDKSMMQLLGKEVFLPVVLSYEFPINHKESVKLFTNHAYYWLQWENGDVTAPTKKAFPTHTQVQNMFRQVKLPDDIKLYRCACELSSEVTTKDCENMLNNPQIVQSTDDGEDKPTTSID